MEKTYTITAQTWNTDIFSGRYSASKAIQYSTWASFTANSSQQGGISLGSGYFWCSSFFFDKGSNATKWSEMKGLPNVKVKSVTLTLTLATTGSYITNTFYVGKKSDTTTSAFGATGTLANVKRTSKTQTSLSFSIYSGSAATLSTYVPTSSGAYIVGQLDYQGTSTVMRASKAVLTITVQYDGGIVRIYNSGSFQQYQVKIYSGGAWNTYTPYIYSNGSWQIFSG